MHLYKWENIPKATQSVAAENDKLQNKIQRIAVSILVGWANNAARGPEAAQLMTDLVNNAPWHGASLVKWVGMFSTMQYSEEKECYYVQKGQKFRKENLDAAKAKPFWEVKPPTKPKPFNIWDAIANEIAKGEKRLKKPVEGDVVDQFAVNKLREVYAMRPEEEIAH